MRTVLVIVVESVVIAAAIVLAAVAFDWVVRRAATARDGARVRDALRRELAAAREESAGLRVRCEAIGKSLAATQTERDRAREAKGVLRRRLRATRDQARAWKGWATSHGWNREDWINAPRRLAKATRRARRTPQREGA